MATPSSAVADGDQVPSEIPGLSAACSESLLFRPGTYRLRLTNTAMCYWQEVKRLESCSALSRHRVAIAAWYWRWSARNDVSRMCVSTGAGAVRDARITASVDTHHRVREPQ